MIAFKIHSLPKTSLTAKCLLGAWLAGAVACIAIDSDLLRLVGSLDENDALWIVADYWHLIGTPLGMVVFLGTALLAPPEIRGRIFVTFAACVGTAAVSAQILKRLIGRTRPQWTHSTIDFAGPWGVLEPSLRSIADSMPSGHTTVAFAMAIAMSWRWPRLKVLWLFLAIGVAISRVILGHHFPSDVLLASWLGTVTAIVALRRMIRFWMASISS